MKPLTRREQIIDTLLDHWQDFFDVGQRDLILSGQGGVFRLSGMSRHPSVVELGRALEALREFAPSKSAHLFAYYAAPYRTTRQGRRAKGGKIVRGDVSDPSTKTWAYERVKVLPRWVDRQKRLDALRLIAQEVSPAQEARRPWVFRGEPFLPGPLLEGMPRSDGPKVAA